MPLAGGRFCDDIHHPAHRAVTVAGRRRAANHVDMIDHFRRYPAGITARIAVAAPAIAHGITTGHRFTIHQNQGVLRSHAANIDLAVITALAAGGVTGEVDAGLGTNQLGDIARGRMFTDLLSGDGRYAGGLQRLRRRGDHHRFIVIYRSRFRYLRIVWHAAISGLNRQRPSPDDHRDQHGQRVV